MFRNKKEQISFGLFFCYLNLLYWVGMIKAVIFDLFGLFVGVQDQSQKDQLVDLAQQVKLKGAQVFILSNYFEDSFPFLSEITDKCYFSFQTGFVKPDEQAYQLVLNENNLKAEECLYFDDSSTNVAAAAELGIRSYLFESAEKTQQILKELKVI